MKNRRIKMKRRTNSDDLTRRDGDIFVEDETIYYD